MPTTIQITPPGGSPQVITVYEKCSTTRSSTDRAGSFSLILPSDDSSQIDAFPVGSDVQITQEGQLFRGWVLTPGKELDGRVRTLEISGPDYTARTQKIVVNEGYVNTEISSVVADLFAKYAPWATRANISPCSKLVTITFPDKFLWDAMEQLCEISGYEWYIDETLDVHFFLPAARINPNVLREGTFWRGSANLKPDASKLVNRLWVKGGKALSDNYTQAISVSGTVPIPLHYKPRATTDGVIVTIDGVQKSVGIQHITPEGTCDFLLNFEEKLLIPDLTTDGSGTIIYRYEYPIKLLLEEPESQRRYGLFEDVLKVDTDDRSIALELGLRHLAKYSRPVTSGSIRPFAGAYRPGELVKVEIPELNTDEYLQIKQVTYESVAGRGWVERSLQLESPERDLSNVLKDYGKRLMKLERSVYQDTEGPVERYIAQSEGWQWAEDVSETVHACPVPAEDLYPSETLYPC